MHKMDPSGAVPYTCPRCGYNCDHRYRMVGHFSRKTTCFPIIADLELTPVVRDSVLADRVYNIPVVPPIEDVAHAENCKVNIYNTINNNVFTASPIQSEETRMIEPEAQHGSASRLVDLEDKYVMYDDGKVYVSEGSDVKVGDWDSVKNSLRFIIETLVKIRMVAYEVYLIRNIEAGRNMGKNAPLNKCLRDYYQFLFTFDIRPYVDGRSDRDVLRDPSHERDAGMETYDVINRFYKFYYRVCLNMTASEKAANLKNVMDVIQNSAKSMNMAELYVHVLDIVHADAEFRRAVA